jgi:uncharacterized membrane protein
MPGRFIFAGYNPFNLSKPTSLQAHDRKQFQVDRIAFYSDAIMAIASTLLILEFKIPPLGRDHNWAEIRELYAGKLYIPILGLIISFYSISRLWFKHHALFEKLINYNKRLLILNQVFLFLIMILPVSTSFMLTDDNPYFIRLCFYLGNLGLCSVAYYFLLVTALRPANKLSEITATEYRAIKRKDHSLFHGLSFLAAAILATYTTEYFYLAFIPSAIFRFYRHFSLLKNYLRTRKKL